jgi:hypothetical protein
MRTCNGANTLFCGCLVAFRDIVPIHEIVDEGLEIVGPAIAVVYVISMLPDIDGQNRHRPLDQRIFGDPVFETEILPSLTMSQAPPVPNCVVPACTNSCWTFSIDPKVSMSAFSSLPGTLLLPFCLIDFQYSE